MCIFPLSTSHHPQTQIETKQGKLLIHPSTPHTLSSLLSRPLPQKTGDGRSKDDKDGKHPGKLTNKRKKEERKKEDNL